MLGSLQQASALRLPVRRRFAAALACFGLVALLGACGQPAPPDPPDFGPDGPSVSLQLAAAVGTTAANVLATPNPVPVGTNILLSATLSSAGGTVTGAEYRLDDGQPWSPVLLQPGDGSFDSASEAASVTLGSLGAGTYNVCVRALSTAGVGTPGCTLLAVYDPSAGFVTGSGTIASPPGAYRPSPTLTGSAGFAFSSQYKKGKTVPDGHTSFDFVSAGLSFTSTSYAALVINQSSTNAQFWGAGFVTGRTGSFQFKVWATDGEKSGSPQDTFRIKIWQETPGGEAVLYDNGVGQALSGGSIQIHSNASIKPLVIPSLSSLDPASGPAAGGNTVTLNGANLTKVSSVKFGSAPAMAFTVLSASKITATAPAGSGAVNVVVASSSAASNALPYSYVQPVGPLAKFKVERAGGGPIGTQAAGTPFAIRVTAQDAAGITVTSFAGTVEISSTGTLTAGGGTTAAFVGGVLTSHTVTIGAPGTFTISATRSGGSETGSSTPFDVVTEAAPTVASSVPASGATVATTAGLSLSFSEPVNVAGAWFQISCAVSGAHPAAVSGGPTTFTLDPSSDFTPGESCSLTVVGAQVTDQDTLDPPDSMAANFVLGFTADAAPTVTGTVPANGAGSVSPSQAIVVNFSESVNAGPSAFTVECPAGSPRAFSMGASPASSFTLTPTGGLPVGVSCQVKVIAAQVSDADAVDPPDRMAADFTFGFTTSADTAPTAVSDSATVNEDSGATAVDVLANDTDPDGGPKTIASVTQPTNGTVVITGGGTGLTYAPNANYCNAPPGTTIDTFTYTLNGGSTATVSMTVTCVDDSPTAVNDSATVNEDSGATAIGVLANDTDPDGGPKTIASVTQPANGSVVITGGGTGLTYTPNANYCNTAPDTFTYTLNGGSSATVSVTVTCVDDPPTAVNDSATVLEDSGATAIDVLANDTDPDGGARSISAVTQPANGAVVITGGGTGLSYAPNADYCTAATPDTFTYTLNGGSVATVSVTVTCVNDVPGFTKGADQTVNEDAGPQTVTPWATAISAGPANESGQTVSFLVSSTTPGLFSAGPAVSPSGVLTYTPAANQNGSATVSVQIKDNGGVANGGADTSAIQTFTITVNAVNDPPVAQPKTASAHTHMKIVGLAPNLLAGVTDADSGVSGCAPTFAVASITSGIGGTVSGVNLAAGTFDFDPAPGFTGAASVNYTVSDSGCPAPAATSAPATITITVSGPVIWFVNPAVPGGGNGTLSSPFGTLAAADAVDGAGQRVFLYSGTSPSGMTLSSGEWLIGQGASGSFDSLFGITPPAGTIARPALGGARPSVGGTVMLAADSRVQGLNISTSGVTGLSGGAVGGVSVSEASVAAASAAAVNLSGTGGTFALTRVDSSNAVSGIVLTNHTGSFSVTGSGTAGSGGTIQTMSGAGIALSGAQSVSLARMNIQSTTDSGIRGTGVSDFSLTDSTINASGSTALTNSSNIAFNAGVGTLGATTRNVSGSLTISGNTLTNAQYHGIDVYNFSGTLSGVTISGNTIQSSTSTATSQGSGLRLIADSSPSTAAQVTQANITGNQIRNFPLAGGILMQANSSIGGPAANLGTAGSATNRVNVTGNLISGNSAAVRMNTQAIVAVVNRAGQGNFNISNNGTTADPLRHMVGTGIAVSAFGNAVVTADVISNVLAPGNTFGSQGIGVGIDSVDALTDAPSLSINILNNTISQTDGNGILAVARNSNGTVRAKIGNNSVAAPLGGVRPGIRVDSGSANGNATVCLNLSGNTSAGSSGSPGIGLRKQGTVSNVNTFGVHGMAATATPGIEAYVNGLNPAGGGTLLISATSGFSTCSLP